MGVACEHHLHDQSPNAAVVAAALAEVAQRLTAAGERMTQPRRRVLELLLEAAEPVKAYDLIGRFGTDGQAAKPPTVYRALEFLERQGIVHRIASISAYVACTAEKQPEGMSHAAAFLICDCCGATEEVPVAGAEVFSRAATQAGYAIERTTIEGHGRCPTCQKAS